MRQNIAVLGNSEDYYSTMIVYDNADEIKILFTLRIIKQKRRLS